MLINLNYSGKTRKSQMRQKKIIMNTVPYVATKKLK